MNKQELIAALEAARDNEIAAGVRHAWDLRCNPYDHAISLVNQLGEPAGWQDISTAPKDGARILAYQESSEGVGVVSWARSPGNGVWLIDAYGAGWMYPTHWMPLPPALSPEQKGHHNE